MIFEVIKGTGLLVLALLADPVAAQAPTPAAARAIDAAALYQQHCASCHGEQRLGGMGPELMPELSLINISETTRRYAISYTGIS